MQRKGWTESIYVTRACYLAIAEIVSLAIDEVVTYTPLHKKLEDVKKDIKGAERGVILKINQLYENISLAATTIDVCMPVSTTGLEAHSHCNRIVKEAGRTSPGVTVSTSMA